MKRDDASATDPCHDFADGTRERRSDPAPNFSNVPGVAFVDHTGPLKLRGCWTASYVILFSISRCYISHSWVRFPHGPAGGVRRQSATTAQCKGRVAG